MLSRSTLRAFWLRQPAPEKPLRAWLDVVEKGIWAGPADVKTQFGRNVDFVGDNRIIFDIGGNNFRLIVQVSYSYRRVLIKFIGTHAEYDKIDPETVDGH